MLSRIGLLRVAALVEGATGLALTIVPSLVARLLLGDGVSSTGMALARIAGFGLLALALACWPASVTAGTSAPALRAMLVYNLVVTLYLAWLGVGGRLVGILLWPATAYHAVMTILLARAWFSGPGR